MTTFKKTTPTCSNIYLIDENLCLANALGIINYNIASLSSAISDVSRYNSTWLAFNTIFTAYSSKWIETATNIQSFSAMWIGAATTVSTLSSNWNKLYTLYYPKMININDWEDLSNTDKNNLLITWLNRNFNPKKYNLNQLVDVVVYLNQNKPFSFRFNRSLYEPCTPTGGGLSVSCNGCGQKPWRGCNHHGGKAGYGPCTNAYDACSIKRSANTVSVSCTGSGQKTLKIGLNRNAIEKITARTVEISFKNVNRSWTAI
jgi:hypothetical protein